MPGADDNKNDQQLDADDQNKNKDGAGSGDQDKKDEAKGGIKTLDEALKEIESLRKENGSHRTKNKSLEDKMKSHDEQFSKLKKAMGIEDESEDPEVKVKTLSEKSEALELELGLVTAARDANIPKEHDAFFRFLLKEKVDALEEGQELGEDEIAAVAAEVMKYAGQKKQKSTGVDEAKDGKDSKDTAGEVTQEQYNKMGIMEKNALYTKNPDLYLKLSAGSKK